jgi:hypothetical protein
MRTQLHHKPLAAAAVAMLALVLGSQPAARAASDGPPAGAQSEGIKVHGQWTIDIRNTDGSLASHHEFKNALDSFGATALAQMLGRQTVTGVWGVSLWQIACVIGEVGSTDPEAQFKTLTVTVPTAGPNAGKLVLSGNATAEADGDIAQVGTGIGLCGANTAPAACTRFRDIPFTAHNFPSPIVVLAGQIIQVTVVISFS